MFLTTWMLARGFPDKATTSNICKMDSKYCNILMMLEVNGENSLRCLKQININKFEYVSKPVYSCGWGYEKPYNWRSLHQIHELKIVQQ